MRKHIFIIAVICILLAGCGNDSGKTTPPTTTTSSISTTTTSTTTSSTTSTTTTKKITTKKPTTAKICKSKKFANKYTYVYNDEATCKKEGNTVFNDLYDQGLDVMLYDCEKIVDDCGDTYYGVVFYNCPDDKCKFNY